MSPVEHLEKRLHLPELDGTGRLGRHVEHDARSRGYRAARTGAPRRNVLHRPRSAVYDQGAPVRFRGKLYPYGLGSCTGNGLAKALSSGPNRHRFLEPTAVRIYARGTELDSFDGTFPPDDTGSSGLAVCKAALERGWITSYLHAFSLDELLDHLQERPVIVGIAWKTGCDTPDSSGLIRWTGDVRGGHELAVLGDDPQRRRVRLAQSWGNSWGDHGFCDVSYDDLAAALADDGDCTVPVAA